MDSGGYGLQRAEQSPHGLASSEDIVERVRRVTRQHEMTLPLARLFLGLGRSLAEIVLSKTLLREQLTKLFFAASIKSSSLQVTSAGLRCIENIQESERESLIDPGDLMTYIEARRTNPKIGGRAVELMGKLHVKGVPMLSVIARSIKAGLMALTDPTQPRVAGEALLLGLKQGFRNTNETFAPNFIRLDQCETSVEWFEIDHAKVARVTFAIPLCQREMKKHYHSMYHALKYLKELEITMVGGPNVRKAIDTGVRDEVGYVGRFGPAILSIQIDNRSGAGPSVTVELFVKEDGDCLVYFDRLQKYPLRQEEKLMEVEFESYTPADFLFHNEVTLKLGRLGCASYKLPEFVTHMHWRGTKAQREKECLDLRMVYMEAFSKSVLVLSYPFLNLPIFLELLSEMSLSFSVLPESGSDSSIAGILQVAYQIALLRPRAACMTCVTAFAKRQLKTMSILDFLRDFFTALGRDLTPQNQ